MLPGRILDIEQKDEISLAVFIKKEKDKYVVMDHKGKIGPINPGKVLCESDLQLSEKLEAERVVPLLKEYMVEIEKRQQHIDLALLWESLEPSETYDFDSLVGLYFSPADLADHFQKSAFIRALQEDTIYFQKKKGSYIPKAENLMKERLTQVRKEEAEEMQVAKGIEEINRALHLNQTMTSPGPDILPLLERLKTLAIHGDAAPQYSKTLPHLRKIHVKADPLPRLMALECLVRLGIWSEDQHIELIKYNTPIEFKPKLLQITSQIAAFPDQPDMTDRLDLTAHLTVTIDDEDTLDMDDALSMEAVDSGYILGIHIIDVSHFIKRNEPLDHEAAHRSTTIYLPEMIIPMFPEQLSLDILSLRENTVRPCLSFLIHLNHNMDIAKTEIVRSVIKIDHKLSYNQVDRMFETSGAATPRLFAMLSSIKSITDRFRELRRKQGALFLRQKELKMKVDKTGEIFLASVDNNSLSRKIVAESMIFANYQAARFCFEHDIPAIYRIQAPPKELPFNQDREVVDPLGHFQVVSTLNRTETSASPALHFCLGVEYYTQVTSPMRRYQDLIIERQINGYLERQASPYSEEELKQIAHATEEALANATMLETNRRRYWILKYFRDKSGLLLRGTVLKILGNLRYLVELDEYFIRFLIVTKESFREGDLLEFSLSNVYPRRDEIFVKDIHLLAPKNS